MRRTVGDFSELRARVARVRGIVDLAGAYPSNGDKRVGTRMRDETEPSLGAVLVMDAVVCAHCSVRLGLLLYDFDGDGRG